MTPTSLHAILPGAASIRPSRAAPGASAAQAAQAASFSQALGRSVQALARSKGPSGPDAKATAAETAAETGPGGLGEQPVLDPSALLLALLQPHEPQVSSGPPGPSRDDVLHAAGAVVSAAQAVLGSGDLSPDVQPALASLSASAPASALLPSAPSSAPPTGIAQGHPNGVMFDVAARQIPDRAVRLQPQRPPAQDAASVARSPHAALVAAPEASAAGAGTLARSAPTSPRPALAAGDRESPVAVSSRATPAAVAAAMDEDGTGGAPQARAPAPADAQLEVAAPVRPLADGSTESAAPAQQPQAPGAAASLAAQAVPASPASTASTASAGLAAPALHVAPPVGSQQWAPSLGQQLATLTPGREVELNLNPEQLGPLKVTLTMSDARAHLAFTSDHAAVRQALEAALPQLRASFADSGISLGQATVGHGGGSAAGQAGSEPGRGGSRGEPDPHADAGENGGSPHLAPRRSAPLRPGGVDTFA